MSQRNDGDNTNIGGALPAVPRPTPAQDPFAWPAQPPAGPGAPPAAGMPPAAAPDNDRTVIGGALPPVPARPPAGAPPGSAAPGQPPFGSPSPWPSGPATDNTWIGGALPAAPAPQPAWPASPGLQHPPGQPYGAPPQAAPPPAAWPGASSQPAPGQSWSGQSYPGQSYPGQAYPGQSYPGQAYPGGVPGQPAPAFGLGLGTGLGSGLDPQGGQGFFPASAPQFQPGPNLSPVPRVSLQQALRATGIGDGGSTNPLLASATNLLILFGRLRTGIVEMDPQPLIEHVTREIEGYEARAIAQGAPPQEAMVGKYLLCGTADDIVQNLPGADRGIWIQYSMAARFFNTRDTGVGFFREAEKAIQSPAQYANLLELMQVCLSLGFEGQYRTVQGGVAQLSRIRAAIYEAVRRVRPRPDEDLSRSWQAVLPGGRRRFGAIPVWAIGGMAAATLVAFFATLSTLITNESTAAAQTLYTLHPLDRKIALNGVLPAKPFVAETSAAQLERIQSGLQSQIDQGLVSVGEIGDFIYIRVGNLLLFELGSAEVKPEFSQLAGEIARVVNAEAGPVLVEGHTDASKPKGTARYKTNLALSLARAESVGAVLGPLLTDPTRLKVEGQGEAQPIADNATREGAAANRRVEVMIAKEGTFEAP